MNKKILILPCLIFLFSSFSTSILFGQNVIRFATHRATQQEDAILREQFKEYTIGKIPTEITSDLLRSKDYFDELRIEVKGRSFSFDLLARDIRAPHYKLRVHDSTGVHQMPRSPNKTYKGYTTQGHYDVRITADDHFFYALIEQQGDAFYIEPANNFIPDAPTDQFVMYWSSDNLNKMTEKSCGVTNGPVHNHSEEIITPEENENNRLSVCKTVQIALADDFEMFQQEGSVTEVENHNLAVINNVETNYDDEFTTDLEFDIVEIYVATSNGTDPWTNSTDAEALLDDFTDWGPTGFENTHDEASLWTNRNFDGDVIGLAWISGICNQLRYNVLEDFTGNANLLRCLQAHEMGHNFSAGHDAVGEPFIMAPSVQNTNNWSTASQNSINSYIPTRVCLGPCGIPLPPVADFSADDDEGCASFTVHFTDESDNNPTSWSWVFPGGSPGTSTMQNPNVTYNTAGEYNVTLTATNASGSNSLTQFDFIIVGDDPYADFDYNIDELEVDFENLSLDADTYLWNFDDGSTSTLENPVHEYEEDGVYNVKLTVTNECGTDFIIIEVEIITLPWADFDADPTEGCDPMEVEFINYSSSNANTFLWSFPGGSPPTSTAFEPTIIYETPGVYTVTLTAYNDAGSNTYTVNSFITLLPQPNAIFTYEADGLEATFSSAGSVGSTYSWNFGDGETSNLPNPVHIYDEGGTYTVNLVVSNDCGTDTYQSQVTITGAPVAAFSANQTSGCAPFVVQFINQSVGLITSYSWVFQGGSPATSNSPNPVVTYNNVGTFDVTLTVSNAAGNDVQFNDNYITVHPETQSAFDFTINGMQVNFTNLSSNSTGSTWNFGDGFTSGDSNPVHVYNQEGVYTVVLTSLGICGDDVSTAQITIASLPTANFTFQQNGDCAPATVQYTNQSSSNVTGYKWTFEGGTPGTSIQPNPLITYNSAGSFDVELIVFAAAGNDTLIMTSIVTLGDSPDAGFLLNTVDLTVSFENVSSNADSYDWSFGDGQSSNEENPTHTYSGFGTYLITLIASNECGDDTSQFEIVLGTVPNAAFTYTDNNGCAPFEVQYIDQSQNNPTSWMWTFEGGTPSTSILQNPVVVYESVGNYSVTLQVTNAQGTDVLMLNELIQVANPPDATFDYNVLDYTVSLVYNGIDYDSLHWDFGNGTTDNSINPIVQYSASGFYEITLTTYNACGSDSYSVIVDIEVTATDDPVQNINGWQIRPNPVGDYFFIFGEPLTEGTVKITMTDMHGQILSSEDWTHKSGSDSKEMRCNQLPAGVFLVQIQDGKSSVVLKAVHQ